MDDNDKYIIEKLTILLDRTERLEKKIDELIKSKDNDKGISLPLPNTPYPFYPSTDPIPNYPYNPIIYCQNKDTIQQSSTTVKLGDEETT